MTQEILTRLQNGESIESIAAEMTAALNEAKEAFAAENTKRKTAIDKAARNLVHYLLEYLELVAPEYIEDLTKEEVQEFVRILSEDSDALRDVAAMFAAIGDMKVVYAEPTICCDKASAMPISVEDALNEFLKKNFLS